MAQLRQSKLRYIEVSRRNPVTRILVGTGSQCGYPVQRTCNDICIEIRRAGHGSKCPPETKYNACCQPEPVPFCDLNVMTVCSDDIDDEGFAIFVWPEELYHFKEGWYEGHVVSDCHECGVLPLRIGPRCNVLEVEHVVAGPDSACWVGCDDDCNDDVCPPKRNVNMNTYIPSYVL